MSYGSTAVDWGSFCRDLFIEYFVQNINPVKLSGVVETDKSLFGRRTKYHRGMSRGHKVWIFGLVERDSNRLLLFPVDNRNADVLLTLIQEHVNTGSTIYSDGWAEYNALSSLGCRHFVIEQKHAFKQICKDAVTGETITVHTNTIEGSWQHAKAHFRRMNRTKIEHFEGHLCEMMA